MSSAHSAQKPIVAITAGDVAGIGPEVVVRALQDTELTAKFQPLLIGHPQIFQAAATLTGCELSPLSPVTESDASRSFRSQLIEIAQSGQIPCLNPSGDHVLQAPRCEISASAGDAAFQYLTTAIRLAQSGDINAITTAPLNKESLHRAGHHYPGHTEILAEQCGVSDFAMMLHLPESALKNWRALIQRPGASGAKATAEYGLSIAHVTLHTSIASVPNLLTPESVSEKIRLMSGFLTRIGCRRRAIAVCALNPHGGEHGLFGNEECELIEPGIRRCRADIPNLYGPLPVDTLMRRAISGEFDGIVAMYHDQGHIPVKLIGFDSAVNITLGLPIVRTSPTHGTAFDRAWNAQTPSDSRGMTEAIRIAIDLSFSQSREGGNREC
jgi:4-hydroxythreonine-4-phosphate dehydrogenase